MKFSRFFLLFGFALTVNLSSSFCATSDEKFFGTESFVPDWRAAEEIDQKASDRFLVDVWPMVKGDYETGGTANLENLPAEVSASGAVVFTFPYLQPLLPDYLPKENEMIGGKISLFAAKGESEPFLLGVRTLGGAKTISVQPGDLKKGDKVFPKEDVSVRLALQYLAKAKAGRSSGQVQYVEKMQPMVQLKPPEGKWKFPPKYSIGYIIDFHVPADAEPGLYQGEITVLADDKVVKAVPIELEVLPFSLKTNNYHAGAFGISYKRHAGGFLGYSPEMIEVDSRFGYSLAGGFFNKGNDIPFKPGTVPLEINTEDERFQKFDATMQLLKKYGMGRVAFWNWGASGNVEHFNVILKQAGFSGINTDEGKKGFAAICRAIKDAEKKYGWPELVINPYDEALDDQPAVKEIIKAMPYVQKASPETRIYMTEWHPGYARLYQSNGDQLKGKGRPSDEAYKKIPENQSPQLNFHVIGSNVCRDDSRAVQDKVGGEYWTYGGASKVGPQARFLYGLQGYRVRTEATLIWANYRGSVFGVGQTVNFILPDDKSLLNDSDEKEKAGKGVSTHGLVIPSVKALLVREGIDDRKYIETLKYYAQTKKSEENLTYLNELMNRCKEFASMKDVGGRENIEADVGNADRLQSIRVEVKDRILKLMQQ
jgi:hypothetical protein